MDIEQNKCTQCKEHYKVTVDDKSFYQKMNVPVPILCPECRFKRRAQFRNEMSLYNRSCTKCDKKIISVYSPDSPYIVYCLDCSDSDDWDPYSYAKDYNLDKPFFDQFNELMIAVPKKALGISAGSGPNINSDYTNVASANKNCYFLFNTSLCEDSFYGRGLKDCKEVIDMYFGVNNELCYEGVNVNKSSGIIYGNNVNGSFDSIFILNVSGVNNCFGSVNIRNKSYLWFNEQLSKEEYFKRLKDIQGSYIKMEENKKKFNEHKLKFPMRENNNIKTTGSTGDYLFECNNVMESFEVTNGENCKYMFSSKFIKDSYDVMGYGYNSELLLDCCATGLSSNVIGSSWVELSKNISYSFFTKNCSDCFGCDAIKNGQYCLLNKKYSKEEYTSLTDKIKDQMRADNEYGVFIPPNIAHFAYNETVAQDNMPLTKAEALKQGYRWQDKLQHTTGKETMKTNDIPDHINDVKDSVADEIFGCVECNRNYRITSLELILYKKMILPLPRKCFYCRHADRLKRRGPMKIYDRICAKCEKQIKTNYASDRPEIVYCEECYQAEVI